MCKTFYTIIWAKLLKLVLIMKIYYFHFTYYISYTKFQNETNGHFCKNKKHGMKIEVNMPKKYLKMSTAATAR